MEVSAFVWLNYPEVLPRITLLIIAYFHALGERDSSMARALGSGSKHPGFNPWSDTHHDNELLRLRSIVKGNDQVEIRIRKKVCRSDSLDGPLYLSGYIHVPVLLSLSLDDFWVL